MRPAYKRRGLTLVELVLALLLLSVVILTGVSMELGMRRIFSSADTEAQLLQEAAPIMALVGKVVNRGIGENISYPLAITGSTSTLANFNICIESNNDSKATAADTWVDFRFINNSAGIKHQLRYYPSNASASYQLLSQRVVFFNITNPDPVNNPFSNVTLILRKDPDTPAN